MYGELVCIILKCRPSAILPRFDVPIVTLRLHRVNNTSQFWLRFSDALETGDALTVLFASFGLDHRLSEHLQEQGSAPDREISKSIFSPARCLPLFKSVSVKLSPVSSAIGFAMLLNLILGPVCEGIPRNRLQCLLILWSIRKSYLKWMPGKVFQVQISKSPPLLSDGYNLLVL